MPDGVGVCLDRGRLLVPGQPAGPIRSNRFRTVHHGPFPAGAVQHQETAMSVASLIAAQDEFTAHLPAVENAARFAFRRRFRMRRGVPSATNRRERA